MLWDVFQPGLIRGVTRFDRSGKAYVYVEHPTEHWRVYLRSCMFLHAAEEPTNPTRFLVVKRTGRPCTARAWEPPKGQMEAKECKKGQSLMSCLVQNALREVEEEAYLKGIQRIRHTGLVLQSQESDYPPHHYFQYHLFQGFVSAQTIEQGVQRFQWRKEHPKAVERWRADRKEKDALAWFDPEHTRLASRWAPTLVAMYLSHSIR